MICQLKIKDFVMISENWMFSRDGNLEAFEIFKRHYTFREGRKKRQFVGPGEKLVLLSSDFKALFVWRKFISMNNQKGINCAVFRNESNILSSKLILEAERIAIDKWPNTERFYTYVNLSKVKSINPGYCFLMAGWNKCGITKIKKLIILEKYYDNKN